ncbi:hypothetical protein GCM10027405_18310 [Arthrobacter alkaliphilus]|uniref:hypothetical protein n=1 Tax=Arthrobacter alkaliphilus TaxID=369936 RepID=UPI001F343D1D|nr:hypothetical protein [Arthrobacter alkaliphilus]
MTQRSSARAGGTTRAAVRRPFSVALAGIAMAVTLCAFPVLSAHAAPAVVPGQVSPSSPAPPASPAPAPAQPEPAQPKVADPAPAKPPVAPPAPAPVEPAPAVPAPVVPAPAAPEPAPMTQVTVEPEPVVAPSEAPVASSPALSTGSPTAAASPSASSNWDTPIQVGLKATQAASVSTAKGPGSDLFAVFAIMGGVLLVAAGGIAFALWSRNRYTH